jgi:hypothetical protein
METNVTRFRKIVGNINETDIIVAVLLILLGYVTRVVPHLANFSPMIAIALFSGYYFRRSILAWVVPLCAVILSDMVLGFYAVMPIIWFSYVVMALLAVRFIRGGSMNYSFTAAILGAVFFFIVSNFAVWAEGRLYAFTWQGFVDCFAAALPFFRATLISSIMYSIGLFGTVAFLAQLTARQPAGENKS